MRDRIESIDLLRIIAIFLIVCLHISPIILETNSTSLIDKTCVYSLRSICLLGVSLFGFISGYFGVKWNANKFLYYYILVFFWGAFFVVLEIYFDSTNRLEISKIIRFLFPISGQVCWYASAYLFLMVLIKFTPQIIYKQKFSSRFGILIFTIVYGGEFILNTNSTTPLMLIELYIIGRYFRNSEINIIEKHSGIIFFLGIIIQCSLFGLIYYCLPSSLSERILIILSNNHNPLLIITAISMFYYFKKMKVVTKRKSFRRLSEYVFPIYIIHAFAKHSILNYSEFVINTTSIWVSLWLLVIATLIICTAMEYIRKKVLDKKIRTLIDYLVNKV